MPRAAVTKSRSVDGPGVGVRVLGLRLREVALRLALRVVDAAEHGVVAVGEARVVVAVEDADLGQALVLRLLRPSTRRSRGRRSSGRRRRRSSSRPCSPATGSARRRWWSCPRSSSSFWKVGTVVVENVGTVVDCVGGPTVVGRVPVVIPVVGGTIGTVVGRGAGGRGGAGFRRRRAAARTIPAVTSAIASRPRNAAQNQKDESRWKNVARVSVPGSGTSRAPHSRQYSWNGSCGLPQR